MRFRQHCVNPGRAVAFVRRVEAGMFGDSLCAMRAGARRGGAGGAGPRGRR